MRIVLRLAAIAAILLGVAGAARAQVLSIDLGGALSNQYASQITLLPVGKMSFAGNVAVEYLQLPYFCMRSGLGYRAIGGQDNQNAPFSPRKGGRQANETFHMLQLNTLVRTGYRVGLMGFFLGFGPKVDFVMGKAAFKEKLFSDYKVSPAVLGVRYELGLDFWLAQDKMKLGLLCGYENDITSFAKTKGNSIYNQTYELQLSVGIRLNGKSKSEAQPTE